MNNPVPPIGVPLPDDPSEKEIRSLRLLSEPLTPVGHNPSPRENQALLRALRTYATRIPADNFSALEEFLEANHDSSWASAVSFNLAVEYYNTGWYSKALATWEESWPRLKEASDPAGKALADRAAGELAYMYGRLGRMQTLEALLDSVKDRVFVGSATEKIAGAKQGLWTMQHWPEIGFRCGPFALGQILGFQNSTNAASRLILESKSTTNGFALSEVAALSRQLGMNYQMAYRSNGAPLIMPAVVNWKVGHYAALLREENGLYLLQDPTFGNDTWVSRRAFEAETSGYFLVPPGELAPGWRPVSEAEGSKVFGKGTTSAPDTKSTTGCDQKMDCGPQPPPVGHSGPRTAMAVANVHLMVVSLNIEDTPVGYRPPVGPPVNFRVTYNQREANQPANFSYSNLGPKWTFNWLAYINDNPSSPSANVDYYAAGGGALPFTGFNTNTQSFAPQVKTLALLKRTSTNSYEMLLRDGSKIIFDLPDSTNGTSRRVFMTQLVDPQGNALQISYDGGFRVTGVTDAIGQTTTFSYEHPTDTLKITKVTDPFGRFATFNYDANNRLAQITDPIGITSTFHYDSGDFIQELVTPYGTNRFEKGESGRTRWLNLTYPDGGKERIEYNENTTTGIPASDPANTVPTGMGVVDQYLVYRNTFFWDRKAYAEAPGDYTKAHIYHWLHQGTLSSGVLESEKPALENRVWFTYDGQSDSLHEGASGQPNAIGRVLDDGTTQLAKFKYNALGLVTNSIDPLGRSVTYIYSTNLVDLLEVRQTTGTNNDLLAKFIYNAQHLSVAMYDPAGQLTTNTYNARGQLTATTNPKGETSTFTYDTNGYLLAIDAGLPGTNDSVRFTHDLAGRVRTVTGPDGYTITNGYDNLDRLTNVFFPDGTFAARTFDKLDLVKWRDRQGRELKCAYDSLRRLISIIDPLNRTNRLEYCDCGSLSAVIDPLNRPIRWDYDLEGRVVSQQYANGDRRQYSYENTTSRVKSIRDEMGQVKLYEYNADDTPRRISYPLAQLPTPAVNIAYDANYSRITTVQDGIGTTTYSYYPTGVPGALRPAVVDGPWANDTTTYQYDVLGRPVSRAINGIVQTVAYDALGRTTNTVNALGSFQYTFDGPTPRVLDASYPNGQTAHYDFFNHLGDDRLQSITHRKPDASIISRFTYTRNSVGNITNWVQQLGAVTNIWSIAGDAADQLAAVLVDQDGSNYSRSFSYDPAGNRLSDTIAGTNRTSQFNAANQLVYSSDATLTNSSYEWDAENRLVAVNTGNARMEFSYDGEGRRSRIVEKTNGVVQSERRYVWCAFDVCEERDGNDVVLRRFFRQGFTAGGASYYYTRDHLGSVREIVDAAGQVQSRYAYDPFGELTTLQENVTAAFGFTGHFRHDRSGLWLTAFRTLNPRLGRWLSRDPLGEVTGLNLYTYVGNDPINHRDPLGLCAEGEDVNYLKEFKLGTESGSAISGFLGTAYDTAEILVKDTRYALDHYPNLKGFFGGLSRFNLGLNLMNFAEDPTWGKALTTSISIAGNFNPYAKAVDFGVGWGDFLVREFYTGASGRWGSDNVDIYLVDLWDNLSQFRFSLPEMHHYHKGDFCLGQP